MRDVLTNELHTTLYAESRGEVVVDWRLGTAMAQFAGCDVVMADREFFIL